MTATTRTLAEIMKSAEITAASHDDRELETRDGWQHYASTFDLTVRGEVLISHGSYSQGLAHDHAPTSEDIFGSIVMDCQSVAPYLDSEAQMDYDVQAQTRQNVSPTFPPSGWEEWASDMGDEYNTPAAAVKSMRDFQEVCSRAALLRDRLGSAVFDELMAVEI